MSWEYMRAHRVIFEVLKLLIDRRINECAMRRSCHRAVAGICLAVKTSLSLEANKAPQVEKGSGGDPVRLLASGLGASVERGIKHKEETMFRNSSWGYLALELGNSGVSGV